MWLVLGTKEKTERVPNGRQVEHRCTACGEVAMFYERRATSTFQLYFIDIVDFKSRIVMACGACGMLYATDDGTAREPDALEKVTGVAEQVGARIASGATRAADRLTSAARSAFGQDRAPPPPEAEPATSDPLADEDAAVEARFKELEARVRIRVDK